MNRTTLVYSLALSRMLIFSLVLIFLTGCGKDIFYKPISVQDEVDKAVSGKFDGMIVYVNQAGQPFWYSGGYMNREAAIPTDPNALFKIASISKLYIAAAVAKLAADGTLNLDEPLVSYLPEVHGQIEYADEITLRMMVGHRSGIPEYIYVEDTLEEIPEYSKYMNTARVIFGKPADFAPDKKYRYSNTNYLLIGEILDRSLGYSHHRYIKEEILDPLGLKNTFSLASEVDPNRIMSGYHVDSDFDFKQIEIFLPGGSMVASAEDVGIFLRALIDGTLFSEEEQAIYTSIYEYEHTGWLNGYCSIARYHPDIDAVVIQFVNTSGKEIFWLEHKRVYNRVVRAVENAQ